MRPGLWLSALMTMFVASAAPSSALMGVPTVACEASPTEVVASSQNFQGPGQFPNVLTFSESGRLVFSHEASARHWSFADVDLVRYDRVPMVLDLYTLAIEYRGDGVIRSRPIVYVDASCLSQIMRRFDDRLTFKQGH